MMLLPPSISSTERLARFVFSKRWIREDHTVRPEAFVPWPYPNTSVTRHLELSEKILWAIGQNIAKQRNTTLLGRADITASAIFEQRLQATPDPLLENPNHAHIAGWPIDKPTQKNIAQELAAESNFVTA